jgi:acyl carrier protein
MSIDATHEDAVQVELPTLIDLVRQVCVDLPADRQIAANSRFIDDIGMESINRLMLMTLVEQEFGVSLEAHMGALAEHQTVGDTARFLAALRAGR